MSDRQARTAACTCSEVAGDDPACTVHVSQDRSVQADQQGWPETAEASVAPEGGSASAGAAPPSSSAASPSWPCEIFARELEVGSWATFDPIYGPEKVLSISRFVLTEPVDGFAQYGAGVEVLHLQVGSRFITRSAYEPVLEVRKDDA